MATFEEIKVRHKRTAALGGFRQVSMSNVHHDRADLIAMVEGLREGIQKYLDGDYPHPAAFRHNKDTQGLCPHKVYYWDECAECNDDYLEGLLEIITGAKE